VRKVALLIDDADLLGRLPTMLAEGVDIVDPGTENAPDAVITDRWPLDSGLPCIVMGARVDAADALAAGASAVLPRDCDACDLALAVEAAVRGFALVPLDLTRPAWPAIRGTPDGSFASEGTDLLTRRELEVLRLVAEGASNKLIARRLGISVHTAKFHVASIAEKLDATGRTDAVAQAVRLGLIML
jgi:DNA-binding NarL/FixJ family response regulator